MRDALFLAAHDLRLALRQRETLLWVFLMPGLFFYFIGTVTGGMGASGPRAADPLVLDIGDDAGFLADELELRLADAGYELSRAATPTLAQLSAAGDDAPRGPWLRIPERFSERVLGGGGDGGGDGATVTLARREASLMGDFDRFRTGRAVYQVLADLVATSAAGAPPTAQSFANLRARPRSLTIAVRPAGKRRTIPSGFEQTIPGTMVMFTLIVLLTSIAGAIVERRSGVLRRLASTPIGRGQIVLGKWAASLALGLVQIGVGMAIGSLAFDMDWGPDLATVVLLLAAWAAFVASLSLLLANLLNTEGQAVAVGVLSANVLAALGGCWWPIEVAPEWMQRVQLFLPTGWAMDALHKLVSFEAGPASVVPHVLALLAGALVLGGVGARIFRFQ